MFHSLTKQTEKCNHLSQSEQELVGIWSVVTSCSLAMVQPVGFRLRVRFGKPDLQAEDYRPSYKPFGAVSAWCRAVSSSARLRSGHG